MKDKKYWIFKNLFQRIKILLLFGEENYIFYFFWLKRNYKNKTEGK